MNTVPLIDILAFFARYTPITPMDWRAHYVRQVKRLRSCHSQIDGGVRRSFYSLETTEGEILNLMFDEEELVWQLTDKSDYVIDRVLAWMKSHKHQPSRAHRIIPYRFELIPKEEIGSALNNITASVIHRRMLPFRFKYNNMPFQTQKLQTSHTENLMFTKHLHYVIQGEQDRYFHLVYEHNSSDWRFMQEVDAQLIFNR